jgi:hypothetical protein
MRDTAKEFAVTGILAAIAVAAILSLYTTQRSGAHFQYSSGLSFDTLPYVYAGLLLFLCLLNCVARLCSKKTVVPEAPPVKNSIGRAAATILLLFLFISGLEKVWFPVLCAAFLCCLFVVYGKRNRLQIAVISAGGAFALHLVFVVALGLRLWSNLTLKKLNSAAQGENACLPTSLWDLNMF